MVNFQLAEAQALKKSATALRNRGELKRAQDTLGEAIRLLEMQSRDHGSTTEARDIRVELADAYGMKGGIFRRLNNLDAAFDAYTRGAVIEENENLNTTYNRSNVISLSITAKGIMVTDPEIRRLLANVIRELEVETVGQRRDEWWAWSDLAQFYLLNSEPEKARTCYNLAIGKTGATTDEIKRHVDILGELADRTAVTAPEIAASIRVAIEELPR